MCKTHCTISPVLCLTLWKDYVVALTVHFKVVANQLYDQFHFSLPFHWPGVYFLSSRTHCWGDPKVWNPCHQWPWQVTQLHSGRQGIQHLVSKCQWEILWVYLERRNQPWQDQQCREKWHAEEGELGLIVILTLLVIFWFYLDPVEGNSFKFL